MAIVAPNQSLKKPLTLEKQKDNALGFKNSLKT
jgi:hypothetical protein